MNPSCLRLSGHTPFGSRLVSSLWCKVISLEGFTSRNKTIWTYLVLGKLHRDYCSHWLACRPTGAIVYIWEDCWEDGCLSLLWGKGDNMKENKILLFFRNMNFQIIFSEIFLILILHLMFWICDIFKKIQTLLVYFYTYKRYIF